MNGIYGVGEAYDEAADEAYDESYDEAANEAYDEALRRGRRPLRPINPPKAPSAFKPRPTGVAEPPVSQSQFRVALARVSQEQNKDRQAIKVVDGRVRGVAAEQGRLSAAMRKEADVRAKAILNVRRDLQSTREVAAMAPLLGNLGVGGQLGAVLPLLLLSQDVSQEQTASSSSGGLFGTGGGGLGGILPLVLVLGALNPPATT